METRADAAGDVPAAAAAGGPGRPRGPFFAWLGVAVVVFSAFVGSNAFSVRDLFFEPATPEAAPPAAGRQAGAVPRVPAAAAPTSLRSHPWWQDVTVLEGNGSETAPAFTVAEAAIQWRVKGTCTAGRLVVRSPGKGRPLVDGPCSGGVEGFGTRSGVTTLQITADGPWRLQVAQQTDVPLAEPPLPAMTAPGAAAVATGTFYDIDKTGIGRVSLHRQADGRYALRLEDFFVTPTADLELHFSAHEGPRSSQDFTDSESELVVGMDVTAGTLNYAVPEGIDPTRFRSVVVWCAPIQSAYAAASLGPVR